MFSLASSRISTRWVRFVPVFMSSLQQQGGAKSLADRWVDMSEVPKVGAKWRHRGERENGCLNS